MSELHYSTLKAIGTSPAHYKALLDTPRKDSSAFALGRGVHALWLENKEPVVFNGAKKRDGKAWAEFVASRDSVEDVLLGAEADNCKRIVDALHRNRHACEILRRNPRKEEAWARELFGIPCAGKIDLLGPESVDELKTTSCAAPRKFLWDAQKYHYDAQLAWYQMSQGVEYIGPDTPWVESCIVAVESVAPYSVQVYRLDNLRLDQGAEKILSWINTLKQCEASGIWPAYSDEILTWDGEIKFSADEDEE